MPIVSADFVLSLAGTPAPPASASKGVKRKAQELITLDSDSEEGEEGMEEVAHLKVSDLKERLAERGMATLGKKAQLADRLRESMLQAKPAKSRPPSDAARPVAPEAGVAQHSTLPPPSLST